MSLALLGALLGGGALYAQPGGGTPEPAVTASGEVRADLGGPEMDKEAKRLLTALEAMHVRVLELQKSARTSKDVIKLNCVNEKLLAVKQLLNIAESSQNDLTEALSTGDRDQQQHSYGQVKLAFERGSVERDEAEGCIGEEIVFVGPTQVEVDGPAIPDDPTVEFDDPFSSTTAISYEPPAYSTPYGQDL
jgi:hypothetical protein